MTDELDPGLRRLFAATAEDPADEAFVAEATARTARRRRLAMIGWALGLLALAAVATALAPVIGRAAAVPIQFSAALLATPFGWAAALALTVAGALAARALAGWRAG